MPKTKIFPIRLKEYEISDLRALGDRLHLINSADVVRFCTRVVANLPPEVLQPFIEQARAFGGLSFADKEEETVAKE